MAIDKVTIETFLALAKKHPVLDVRSPGEYSNAHIPGAISMPLFTDAERKVVGTAYKQESREKAIKLGLGYFGGKMVEMVNIAESLFTAKQNNPEPSHPKTVLVHCWRGGMRSAGVAWLLDLYGFKVYTLAGGYKTYRTWVLKQFEKEYPMQVLGGYTGSGKTELLLQLTKHQECIIDLEGLACHRGSAFGKLGQPVQPSQEMFENLLAEALVKAAAFCDNHKGKRIWLEDESQRIGDVNIPTAFYTQMRKQKLFFLLIPFEERLNFLVKVYGSFPKEQLSDGIMRIQKRLGGLEAKTAMVCLLEKDIRGCFSILLHYYDKLYLKGLQRRDDFNQLFNKLELPVVSATENTVQLLTFYNQAI